MSDFPNIDDILSRQRAERQRRGEQDRENEEAARRHRELLEAFHAIRYFTSDAFPPGTDYYVEFARRLTELVHLLSQRGELERLLERVSDISGNDWETERDARTFVAALLRMAHAGQEHELARRLREAVELPFIGRVNEWLRRDLERTFYACHAQPQEPTSEQLVDAVERLQAAPPPGDPA